MAFGESETERERRVAKLWETLDIKKEGHLDLNGLKKGLKKIDHREHCQFVSSACPLNLARWWLLTHVLFAPALKNADEMLQNILRVVDTNGDGYIDYSGKIACSLS